MDYHRAAACLRLASLALCDSDELQSRLETSYSHLSRVDPQDLPERLHVRFEELVADMRYGGDSIRMALARMNRTDQSHLATRIVSLFGELCRHLPPED
ncbi:hypothetical protein [Cognatilysobacter bugurensis]|uniref:Uncharacterized protein n=1 Tax=Cognatilysobacter bugurensis TaxID=543356 RepID=A0A918T0R0_9GAMM|nr:hypothetical protein [Lysobacter bugurensis]GHA77337.1 hypothetical protein GCM10007067_13370 [Lysobacter bugurensis]